MTESPPPAPSFNRRILRLLRPYPLLLSLLVLTLVAQVWFQLVLPLGLMEIFDKGLRAGNRSVVYWTLGLLALGFLSQTAGSFSQEVVAARLSNRALRKLRVRMFDHVQNLSEPTLRRLSADEIASTFSNDLTAIDNAIVRALPNIALRVVLMVGSIGLGFAIDWLLALTTFVVLPAIILAPRVLTPKAMSAGAELGRREGKMGGAIRETVELRRVIRVFQLRERRRAQFMELGGEYDRAQVRSQIMDGLVGRMSMVGLSFIILLIITVGSLLALSGRTDPSVVIAFILLLLSIGGAAMGMAEVLPMVLKGKSALRRIDALLAEPLTIAPPPPERARTIDAIRSIAFDHVDFSYTGETMNLDGVTFSVTAPRSVAFVGASGSGKSTILNLLLRHYDVSDGRVLINDTDIRDLTEESFRRLVAVVAQENGLFDMSIAENIRVGRADATDEQVIQAAKDANIHDDITRMPKGYDTPVGDGGSNLSGGQRQRIAIARALIREPQLLILDEATASLDPASEAGVQETIMAARGDRLVAAVTHRLRHAAEMDWIYVLDQGKLVEQGDHDALLLQDGIYARLWAKQHGISVTSDGKSARITVERLRAFPFLAELDDALLERLSLVLRSETAEPGDILMREQVVGGRFHIIVRGSVELTVSGPGGDPVALERLEIGDSFGEFTLLDENLPQYATATARTACLFLTMSREDMIHLMEDRPDLRAPVLAALDRRLDATLEELVYRRQGMASKPSGETRGE